MGNEKIKTGCYIINDTIHLTELAYLKKPCAIEEDGRKNNADYEFLDVRSL